VESVHPMTVMMLLNLVYFRGRWTLPFDESATEHAPFRMAGGGTEPTPLMRQTGEIAYFENDALQAIELTYKNADIAFLVLLPRDESTPGAGLDALERRLVEGLWSEVVSRLLPREVEIYLPRFSLGATLSCKAGLEGLGLTLPFGQHADFSGVNDGIGDPILISKVTQLARIEVDEEGTVATAVTALEYIGLSLPPEPIVFRADHPFLFALRKQSTGAIFFLGRLMDPATG
ncbi:MAG: serpin family protein, partial [Pseudomonadota bacterium]